MTWNWAALVGATLAGGTAHYMRLRWRRAPQAFTAMVAVAVCYFVAGARFGRMGSASARAERPDLGARDTRRTGATSATALGRGFADGRYCSRRVVPRGALAGQDTRRPGRQQGESKAVAATVAGLIALSPPPVELPNNSRVAPVELTTYVVPL
jgi:hypothetical protein